METILNNMLNKYQTTVPTIPFAQFSKTFTNTLTISKPKSSAAYCLLTHIGRQQSAPKGGL